MFTGIITGLGRIVAVDALGATPEHGKRLTIDTPPGYLDDVASGDSIALSGACMTVVDFDAPAGRFTVDVSAESLDKTTGLTGTGTVNLEKAMRASDRLGGHVVSGHVDGQGAVVTFRPVGESHLLEVRLPPALSVFVAVKGSITVDGVSLTVNTVADEAEGTVIGINLIPQTLEHTTLKRLAPGAHVNLEVDLFARYMQRMLEHLGRVPGVPSAARPAAH